MIPGQVFAYTLVVRSYRRIWTAVWCLHSSLKVCKTRQSKPATRQNWNGVPLYNLMYSAWFWLSIQLDSSGAMQVNCSLGASILRWLVTKIVKQPFSNQLALQPCSSWHWRPRVCRQTFKIPLHQNHPHCCKSLQFSAPMDTWLIFWHNCQSFSNHLCRDFMKFTWSEQR